MAQKKTECFVIMPFSETTPEHTEEYWDSHFKKVLKPLIEENKKLKAHRSDPVREDILRQIINDLIVSPIVVADLTDHNPNVFWELGVRQSFKHCTITIAEKGTKLPFDVGRKGTIFYPTKGLAKIETFRNKFKKALDDCLKNPDKPDSIILETLSGRGTLFEIFHKEEAERRLDAVITECKQNLSCLDYIVKAAERNLANPKKRSFPTRRFYTPSIELLITNRYVNEPSEFFDLASDYRGYLFAFNGTLETWKHEVTETEEWILENVKRLKPNINKLMSSLEEARNNLSKKY